MSNLLHEKHTTDFDAIRLSIASPDRVLEWSHGEVLKPETINYRTQKPEKDGLFCERIFGPTKDWECYCGKYKGAHYRGIVCDRCGVLVARAIVRRERMGHITLAMPVTHVWFLRGAPSSISLVLNMTTKDLEKVVYFANYVVFDVDDEKKQQTVKDVEDEIKAKKAEIKKQYEKEAKRKDADTDKIAKQQSEATAEVDAEYARQQELLNMLAPKALLSENDYVALQEEYGDLFRAGIGAEAIGELLKTVDLNELVEELTQLAEETQGQRRKKILKRLKMLEGMDKAGIKPEWMIIQHIPVIPPDLRPMVQLTGGRFATSDLNDLYRRVINRNNRLKKLIEMKAPEVICRNEMRMLQEAVDALIDNAHTRSGRAVSSTGGRRRLKSLSDMLRGKQGRFRQNLLGKRVDYSGRSVIVAGPHLKIDECGLPKMMALELFKPFVISKLINREIAHNVKAATRMIERGEADVWDALDEVIKNKYVLLNRAPTLHRLGVQAFKPLLIEGKAIQLHPLVCKGFNADFDGDQMAVHLPLSAASQYEARELMASNHNLLKPSDGSIITNLSHEMVLGIYYATYPRHGLEEADAEQTYASAEEAMYAYDKGLITLQTPIRVTEDNEQIITTPGRVLFNAELPADFGYRNQTFGDKDLQTIFTEVFERYGKEKAAQVGDSLKDFGFAMATVSGLSTGLEDYTIPDDKQAILESAEQRAAEISKQFNEGLITEEERYRLTVEAWRDVDDEMLEVLEKQFANEDNSTTITVDSGARAKMGSIRQISGMIGLLQDVYGNTIELPIRSSYKEGLSNIEYFTAARGARKGLIDTALKTADSGYLTRRMVDVAQDIFTLEEDCGEKDGLEVSRQESEDMGEDLGSRLLGRYVAKTVKDGSGKIVAKRGALLTKELVAEIVQNESIDTVAIRSVLKCLNLRGVCRTCYGKDLATGEMVNLRTPVGVMAAQAVGEPGTQLTLRTFHGGGVAGEDITQGLPRVEELFEARIPKGEAVLSEITGQAAVTTEDDEYILRVSSSDAASRSYKLAGRQAKVKTGDEVKKGDVIATSKDGKQTVKSSIDGLVAVTKQDITVTSGSVRVYRIPHYRSLLVKDGDKIKQGQRITGGSINLQELLRLTDESTVQRYIMTEIQSIFNMQGQTIADKHLEVIVRQMFSRVQVEDPGDSLFVTGDIVGRATVVEENEALKKDKKKPATFKSLLLGITKVSTWSDSFLSAASFQDTTRVLITAATQGRVDHLYGLKENVIIGRQIPVGTGYHGVPEEVDELKESS